MCWHFFKLKSSFLRNRLLHHLGELLLRASSKLEQFKICCHRGCIQNKICFLCYNTVGNLRSKYLCWYLFKSKSCYLRISGCRLHQNVVDGQVGYKTSSWDNLKKSNQDMDTRYRQRWKSPRLWPAYNLNSHLNSLNHLSQAKPDKYWKSYKCVGLQLHPVKYDLISQSASAG